MYLANYVEIKGSTNIKVYYAVFKTQIDEENNCLRKIARKELLEDLAVSFNYLPPLEKMAYAEYQNLFEDLIEKDVRFYYIKFI